MSIEFVPDPAPTVLSAPFWRSGLDGKLRLQMCSICEHIRFPLDEICPRCLSSQHEWVTMTGHGTVQTFIRFQRAYDPQWEDRVPYIVALIELEEGLVMISNVVGEGALDVKVGDLVNVTFERRSEVAALPQFRIEEWE